MKIANNIQTTFLSIVLIILSLSISAQVPQKVSYQSVIRNASGELVKTSSVSIKISILQGSFDGTVTYSETHSVVTNINGLATLSVGMGTPDIGDFSTIDWSNSPYFLKVETDPNGGTSYILTGTSEILSVPYALHANVADSIVNPHWTKLGNNLLYIDGNIGIGTDSPTSKLDIDGEVNVNDNNITNVATPVKPKDAVTKEYVDRLIGLIQTLQNGVTDVDGNQYRSVLIGDQVWMGENLKTTKYRDGTPIPYVTDGVSWDTLNTGAYCFFHNNPSIGETYGYLYNYPAVVDEHRLCPTGWHVPNYNDWQTLINFLGGKDIAGAKMKETGVEHWDSPNIESTNESGFTALAGSWRGEDGIFYYWLGFLASWWSLSEVDTENAFSMATDCNTSGVFLQTGPYFRKQAGLNVRCLKGDTPNVTTTSATNITQTTATSGGNVTLDVDYPVTERGVCWSTSTLPTVNDNKTNDGSGSGSFTSKITGLTEGTTYYLRAYATNSLGTAYGTQIIFNTILTSGLVAYYPFNGNANDESGNENDGSVKNGAILTIDRWGNSNSAFYFDGVDDYITSTIGNQSILTISLWYNSVYPINWYPRLFGIDNIEFLHIAGNHPFYISNNNVGHLGGYPDPINSIPNIPSFNTWHHVVIIHDNSTGKHVIYVDSSLCNTVSTSKYLEIPSGIITIGNTTTGTASDGGAGFKGSIDDIRIYNRALTESEISALYNEVK